jgi:hypothetical protein
VAHTALSLEPGTIVVYWRGLTVQLVAYEIQCLHNADTEALNVMGATAIASLAQLIPVVQLGAAVVAR